MKKINLRKFLKAPETFEDGDKATGSEGWQIEISFEKNPEDYMVLCYTSSSENFNEQIETFYESCFEGQSSNTIVAQDYDVPYEAYISKGKLSEEIYRRGLTPGTRQNIPVRLSNTLANKEKTFMGMVSIATMDATPNGLLKITGTIKHYSGGITENDIVSANTPPTISATTDPVNYTTAQAKTYADIITDAGITASDVEDGVITVFTYANPTGTAVLSTDVVPAGTNNVDITVTDSGGLTDVVTVQVIVT